MKNLEELLSEGMDWFLQHVKTIREYANKRKESEEWLSITLNSISDAVIATDKLANIRFMNTVAETLTGWKQEETTGKPLEDIFNIFNEETRKKVENPVLRVIRGGIAVGLVNHIILIAKDGTEIPIVDSGAPIKDDNGNINGVVVIFRDITERRKLEIAAKDAREYAENIVETVREPLLILDKNLRVISANKSFYDTFKVSPEASENVLVYDLGNHQWNIPKLRELLEGILPKNTKLENYEVKHDFNALGERIMLLNARKIYRSANNTEMVLLAIEDITEHRKEENLKSQEQLESILSSQKDIVFVIYENYEIAFMNSAAHDVFGKNLADKKCYEVIKGWDHPCDPCPLRKIIPTEINEARFQQCIVSPNSIETKFFDIVATHIEDFSGKPAIVEILRDFTTHKMVEDNLKKSEKMYRGAFNRVNFYKDLFAHDMNNILQSFLSGMQFSEAILDNDPSNLEELKTNIRMMKNQIIRGSDLISNVRKLSQLEEIEIPIKKIEIYNILKNSISVLKKTYHKRNINIQVHSIGEKLYIQGNEFLEDVFENILINAVRHNKNPSIEITVRISRNQKNNVNYIKMEFLDNGKGIKDDRKENIFQRGHSKEKSSPGMGLGLSLVKKIIDAYDGELWVEDKVKGDHSKGSNFVLLIPEVD